MPNLKQQQQKTNKPNGLHAPFTSSSAISLWHVDPIIDAYFHLFTKKNHLFKICGINLFLTILL